MVTDLLRPTWIQCVENTVRIPATPADSDTSCRYTALTAVSLDIPYVLGLPLALGGLLAGLRRRKALVEAEHNYLMFIHN